MTSSAFRFRSVMAAVATAIASSLLGFIVLMLFGSLDSGGMREPLKEIPVIAAIVLIWVPAFAFVPAAILGFVVERPKARAMIARRSGGLVPHMALSVAAAVLLWALFRIFLVIIKSAPRFMDAPSLALVILIGLCSAIAWWVMVVEPGRRE